MSTTRSRFAVAAALAAATITLAACGSAPIELGDTDDDSAVDLTVGQSVEITLETNPTTGYEWAVDGDVPTTLVQDGPPAYVSETSALGAGGTEKWVFSGRAPGTETLRLKYWRSFEPTVTPIRTFEIDVTVR